MVNAAAVASSNGIAVSTIRHDRQCDYETLLRVTIIHDDGERTIAGTLVGATSHVLSRCNPSPWSRIFQQICSIFAIMTNRDLSVTSARYAAARFEYCNLPFGAP